MNFVQVLAILFSSICSTSMCYGNHLFICRLLFLLFFFYLFLNFVSCHREAVEDCPSCSVHGCLLFSKGSCVAMVVSYLLYKERHHPECKLSKLQSFCEVGCLMHVQVWCIMLRIFSFRNGRLKLQI